MIGPILLIGALTCTVTAVAQQQSLVEAGPPSSHAASFTGRVVDLDGRSIVGAAVWVVPDAATLATMGVVQAVDRSEWFSEDVKARFGRGVTDADGRFAVTTATVLMEEPEHDEDSFAGRLQQEHPRLFVTKSGFAARALPCRPFNGTAFDAGTLWLEPSVPITGRVVSRDGRPIEGATIRPMGQSRYEPLPTSGLTPDEYQFMKLGGNPSWLLVTSSGSDGRFFLDGVWTGEVGVSFWTREHLRLDRVFDVPRGSRDLGDVELILGRELTGSVLDSAGDPIAGARLYAGEQNAFHEGINSTFPDPDVLRVEQMESPWTLTDAEGAFRIAGVSAMTTWIIADADGFEPSRLELDPTADQVHGLVLRLSSESSLELLVRDAATGNPIAGSRCMAWRLASDQMMKDRTGLTVSSGSPEAFAAAAGTEAARFSDSTGLFHIQGCGSFGTDLFVTAPGYGGGLFRQAGSPASSTMAVTIALGPEATITGRVMDSSHAPAAGVTVRAWRFAEVEDWELQPRATTNEEGRFELRGLLPGTWTIEMTHASRVCREGETCTTACELSPGQHRELPHHYVYPP